jgi:flagellar biosynthesis GTPase FlhF
MQLRDYQALDLDRIEAALAEPACERPHETSVTALLTAAFDQSARQRRRRRVIYVLPTGGGKTVVLAKLVKLAIKRFTAIKHLTSL